MGREYPQRATRAYSQRGVALGAGSLLARAVVPLVMAAHTTPVEGVQSSRNGLVAGGA